MHRVYDTVVDDESTIDETLFIYNPPNTTNNQDMLQSLSSKHIIPAKHLKLLETIGQGINVTFTGVYTNIAGSTTEPQLWVNYIYLDTDERRRFAQVSHEYLIEQVQTQEFSWTATSGNQTFKLNFNTVTFSGSVWCDGYCASDHHRPDHVF